MKQSCDIKYEFSTLYNFALKYECFIFNTLFCSTLTVRNFFLVIYVETKIKTTRVVMMMSGSVLCFDIQLGA